MTLANGCDSVYLVKMQEVGKTLIITGLAAVVLGVVLVSGWGKSWLGQLPGDFAGEQGGVKFFAPITTCIIISIIFSLLVSWFRKG